jgi:hypothetical protein
MRIWCFSVLRPSNYKNSGNLDYFVVDFLPEGPQPIPSPILQELSLNLCPFVTIAEVDLGFAIAWNCRSDKAL